MFRIAEEMEGPNGVAPGTADSLSRIARYLEQLQLRASTARSQVDPDGPEGAFVYRRLDEIATRAAELAELLERANAALDDPPPPQGGEIQAAANGSSRSEANGNGSSQGPYSFAAKNGSDHQPRGASPAAVRLLATQLAEEGSSREEIERRLRSEFGVDAPAALVPDLLAKAAS